MVKKIKKYLKFGLCCALIMSLVAPSYAALSASDGSAFVTKAEFDAALADFNSRLTTFEAGINSKIDSQVTSYLDRNGIWNGSAQTLTNSYGVYQTILSDFSNSVTTSSNSIRGSGLYWSSMGSSSAAFAVGNVTTSKTVGPYLKWRSNTNTYAVFTICDNVTKSGLLSAMLNSKCAYDNQCGIAESTKFGYKYRDSGSVNWANKMLNGSVPPSFELVNDTYAANDGSAQISVVIPNYSTWAMYSESSGYVCYGEILIVHNGVSSPAFGWKLWDIPYAGMSKTPLDNVLWTCPLPNCNNINSIKTFCQKADTIKVRYTIQGYGRYCNYNDTYLVPYNSTGSSTSWFAIWTAFNDFKVY